MALVIPIEAQLIERPSKYRPLFPVEDRPNEDLLVHPWILVKAVNVFELFGTEFEKLSRNISNRSRLKVWCGRTVKLARRRASFSLFGMTEVPRLTDQLSTTCAGIALCALAIARKVSSENHGESLLPIGVYAVR